MKKGIYDYGSKDCFVKVVNSIELQNFVKIKCALIYKKSRLELESPKYRKLNRENIKHWKRID